MKVSFARLKEGWGIRVADFAEGESPPKAGEKIVVTKMSGEEREERLGTLVWEGDDDRTGGRAMLFKIDRETGREHWNKQEGRTIEERREQVARDEIPPAVTQDEVPF